VSGKRWVFLDDSRTPPIHLSKVFDIVRSHDELVEWVNIHGIPHLISFDYDLHSEHVSFFFERGGFKNPPDPSNEIFVNPTGYDSAKWFAERCKEKGVYPKYVIVHSNNLKGGDLIYDFFMKLAYEEKIEIACKKTRWGISPKN